MSDMDTLRDVVFRMAEDITRIKVVCTQEHPPKMGSPNPDWPAGTETRHSDGTRCVLLNDGEWAVTSESPSSPAESPDRCKRGIGTANCQMPCLPGCASITSDSSENPSSPVLPPAVERCRRLHGLEPGYVMGCDECESAFSTPPGISSEPE